MHILSDPQVDLRTANIQLRRAERRERIISAATELACHGYDACLIRSVASSAGVSASTVYQYFPSKDDLLLGCFYEWLWDFETEHRYGTKESDPFQRLLQAALTLTERLTSSPLLAEAMIRPYLYADGTAAAQADMVRGQVVRIFVSAFGDRQLTSRQMGVTELLSDVWITNITAFTQQRIASGELSQRLTRTVALLAG
ncbi:TetR family transcriptional regulator [Mycobacterium syngnathidarum]